MKWTSEYQTLDDARANANKWTVRALVTALVAATLGYLLNPLSVPPLPSLTDRLVFALRWQAPSLGTLLFGILAVSNKRFHSRALDPVSGKDREAVAVPLRYLQSTMEQLALSVPSQLTLASYLQPHQMGLVPVLGLLFVAGRLAFWVGYQQPQLGHTNRHFGHVLTLAPSAAAFAYCCLRLALDSL